MTEFARGRAEPTPIKIREHGQWLRAVGKFATRDVLDWHWSWASKKAPAPLEERPGQGGQSRLKKRGEMAFKLRDVAEAISRQWTSIVVALLLASPAMAQTATDGATLRIDALVIRLHGIDAPEMKQRCGDWPAGELAQEALAAMVIGPKVECARKGFDRYNRMLAVCTVDGVDIGAEMVRSGMAWAFTRYSGAYMRFEVEARAANRGVHLHKCEPVWDYRARVKAKQ